MKSSWVSFSKIFINCRWNSSLVGSSVLLRKWMWSGHQLQLLLSSLMLSTFSVLHSWSSPFLIFICSFEVVNRKHVCLGEMQQVWGFPVYLKKLPFFPSFFLTPLIRDLLLVLSDLYEVGVVFPVLRRNPHCSVFDSWSTQSQFLLFFLEISKYWWSFLVQFLI